VAVTDKRGDRSTTLSGGVNVNNLGTLETNVTSVSTSVEKTQLSRGTDTVSKSYDIEANMTMKEILTKLKIINAYLAECQGEAIKEQDAQ